MGTDEGVDGPRKLGDYGATDGRGGGRWSGDCRGWIGMGWMRQEDGVECLCWGVAGIGQGKRVER